MNEKAKGIIYGVGYRPYEGPYRGRVYALASLVWDDLKRGLGVKKSWKYKAIILLLLIIELGIFFFYLVVSQLAGVLGPDAPPMLLNPYSGFYEASALPLLFLSAILAPNLLCDDRRYRVYPLYLARPIQANDYLLAKGGAIFGILASVTLGPALLLFLGKTFLAPDAIEYLREHGRDLGPLLASGVLIALFYTSFSMGISSLTTSRLYAAGAIIGIIKISGFVANLIAIFRQDPWVMLGDLGGLVLRVKDWLFFGQLSAIEIEVERTIRLEALPPGVYLVALLYVMSLSLAILWLSYRREVRS
jgi:ABC-type transport system involved in multi-copper enzyme maturation permease subunit